MAKLSRDTKRWLSISILLLLGLNFLPAALTPVRGFESGQAANAVLGEPNFTSTLNPSTALRTPSNFAFDSSGDLWVADAGNNRVVEETNVGAGLKASIGVVLGQANLFTGFPALTRNGINNPSGMSFDSSGDLWLTDTTNNRVLEYTAPLTTGEAAAVVLGQDSFTSDNLTASASGTSYPAAAVFDSSGNLWVVDGGNNRVLEFKPPFTTGMTASLVIGQPNLSSTSNSTTVSTLNFPTSARFDSSGDLWVADAGNNRVMEFKPPFTTGMSASLVIGQQNFTGSAYAVTQGGLYSPGSLAFDSQGNLWVADTFNSRVVEYTAPFSMGEQASLVLGQQSFAVGSSSTTQTGMSSPTEVGFNKAGDLWVADSFNNRILEFAPPFKDGMSATYVLGQSDFDSNIFGGQEGLNLPTSVLTDSSGDLWVVDGGNNRVMEYKAPIASDENASLAIGQPSLTLSNEGNSSSQLYFPFSAAFDKSGDLWVSDSGNNRVLEFTPPFTTGMAASLVIGQSSFATITAGTAASQLSYPAGIAFDSSGDLWVADAGNNRVMEFKPPFSTGMSASLVLGQPGFGTSTPGISSGEFYSPMDLAFDPSGNLWVADTGNNRVVGFAQPFANYESGSILIGELGYTSARPAVTASSLFIPEAIAFDSAGNLWVSDTQNQRVLEFASPISTQEKASLVIGQLGFLTDVSGTTQTSLYDPLGLAFDGSGNLWLADANNNRVLEFSASVVGTSSTTSTQTVTISSTQTSSSTSTVSASSSTSHTSSSSTSAASTTSSTTTSLPSIVGTTTTSTSSSASTHASSSSSSSPSSSTSHSSSSSTTSSSKTSSSDTYYIIAGVAVVLVVFIAAGLMNARRQRF